MSILSLDMETAKVPVLPLTELSETAEENGSAPMAIEAPVATDPTSFSLPPATEDEELPADFERLWKTAHDNPQDFTSWTDLLQYCEQEVCACYFGRGDRKNQQGLDKTQRKTMLSLKNDAYTLQYP